MTYTFNSANTHTCILVALVALQEHAYALPAPWPLLVDAAIALAEEHGPQLEPRGPGIPGVPKFGEVPVVGGVMPSEIATRELNSPGGLAAEMMMDEANKRQKADEPTKAPEPPQETRAPEPQKQEEPPKPPPPSQAKKAENSGNNKDDNSNSAGGIDAGGKAGLAIAGVMGLGIVIFVTVCMVVYWKNKKSEGDDDEDDKNGVEE